MSSCTSKLKCSYDNDGDRLLIYFSEEFFNNDDGRSKGKTQISEDIFILHDDIESNESSINSRKIVGFEFQQASKKLICSNLNVGSSCATIIKGCTYCVDSDALYISLNSSSSTINPKFSHNVCGDGEYEYSIIFDVDDNDRIYGIEVLSVSQLLKAY